MKHRPMKRIREAAGTLAASLVAFAWVSPSAAQQTPVMPVEPVPVEAIDVRGNERIPEDIVLSTAGIRLGDRVTFREIQQAIRRLWVTDQYADVRILAEEVRPEDPASPVRLIIEVEEQPYVAYLEFRGLENVRAGTVRDTVGLRSGQAYDPARLVEAEHVIREMLAEKGIRLQRMEHRLEPIAGVEGEYRLVIDVEEGQRVAIAEVVIAGNEVFADDEIKDAMSTREEGFLWYRPGLFDDEVLRQDLRSTLPDFYGRQGYIDFTVLGDTLVVDPETGKGRLTVRVSEGARYRLVGFEVRGNRRFPTDDLSRYYESARGGLLSSFGIGGIGAEAGQVAAQRPVFNQSRFQQATEDVFQLYRNEGYLYAQVMPFVERVETDDGEPGVRVGWDIVEREPAYVNRVSVVGNTYTHENVIRDRIFVLPGDVYSEEMLIQSYRAIMGLGFFEAPLPTPRMEQLPSGDVDVTFEVKEKQTGSFNFGTTIGGWGGLAGFIGFDHPNLFGQAKSGSVQWQFGTRYNNFSASYTDPSVRGSQISGSASLFSTKQNRFFQFTEGEYRRTGGSLRFGLPFPWDRRFSRVFVGYQVARTKYENRSDEEGSVFGLPPGLLSTATLSLLRNTLDSPLFPTVGTRNEIRAELSGGPLGGDGDFQKYTAVGSWWVPVGQLGGGQVGVRPVRLALGITAETGAVFGDASGFPFEQFWMGGVQFGQPLRGYDETTITPLGYVPSGSRLPLISKLGKAYVRLSAEYAVRFNDNVSVSAFGDAGNLWRDPLEVNPSKLFRGAGLGVQLVTPFGPMGLDYAYGFDRTEPGWQLHFKFGQTF
ncbi:MAG TPA: outer membrane protein assembly factor BamA [Longimicrobiales bacterium]|nr:outer membrane protein assembly factor BamA [Longimicrobiales bacterium]